MRVLGVDPGTALTGYAVIEEGEGRALRALTIDVIRTEAHTPLPQRLLTIYRGLREIIAAYRPEAAAVEALFFSRNVRTAMAVGQARGVVLLALQEAGLPIAEYTPLVIKQTLTGYGGADKAQMQEMIRLLLHLPARPSPDDAADAAAVAICYLHHAPVESWLTGEQYDRTP